MSLLQQIVAFDATFFMTLLAIGVMLYCMWLVMTLSQAIPGGVVGRQWSVLSGLVLLFTIGYLASPFFRVLPDDFLRLVISLMFFFGAIYVAVTIKLVYRVIKVLTE